MIYKHKTLKNSMSVIMVPMLDNPTVTVAVLIGAGADHEEKHAHGVAHFLEHTCFKGTARRPRSIDISREVEGLGAQTNAFTGRRYTGYHAKAQAGLGVQIFDIVSDVFLNPTFPVAELEKEKGVVIEEINMYEDMPQYQVADLYQHLMYGDTHVGRSIIGTRASVKALTREDVLCFREAHYHVDNVVLVIAGSFDEKVMFGLAENTFGLLPKYKPHKEKVFIFPKRESIVHKEKASEQTHIVFGVPGLAVRHRDEPALKILTTILGGGMSSRLFHRLREELGVCYYVYAHATTTSYYGDVAIHAGIPADRTIEVVNEIIKILDDVMREEVEDHELETAKSYKIGTMMLELEGSEEIGFYYGLQQVTGLPIKTPEERAKELRQVTKDDIKRVACTLFAPEKRKLALIGPKQDQNKLREFLAKQ